MILTRVKGMRFVLVWLKVAEMWLVLWMLGWI